MLLSNESLLRNFVALPAILNHLKMHHKIKFKKNQKSKRKKYVPLVLQIKQLDSFTIL